MNVAVLQTVHLHEIKSDSFNFFGPTKKKNIFFFKIHTLPRPTGGEPRKVPVLMSEHADEVSDEVSDYHELGLPPW